MSAAEQMWFTTTEAAEYIRTTPGALHNLIWRGSLRPDRPGRRGRGRDHLFSRETLDRFVRGE